MRTSVIVVLLVITACSQSATDANDLTFQATTTASENEIPAITTTLTLTNTGEGEIEKGIGEGCPITIHVYRNPDYTGEPAWDQGAWRSENHIGCNYNLDTITLLPGESQEYYTTVAVRDILGEDLPSGTYYFVAILSLEEGAVRVPAGHASLGI